MPTPVNGAAPTTPKNFSVEDNYTKASDLLTDGKFKLDFENEQVANSYKAFLGGLGETTAKGVSTRVEAKMTDWIKSHPAADKEAFQKELKSNLMKECMQANQIKSFLQKGMNDIMAKLKEMDSDRFSDF